MPQSRRDRNAGLTVLELMLVVALCAVLLWVLGAGFRKLTKAELVQDAVELGAVLRRTNQLAIETGEVHRVLFDVDARDPESDQRVDYIVEQCQGSAAIARNEAVRADEQDVKRAAERGAQKLGQLPPDALAVGDPDEAMKRTLAVAGHHIQDRVCVPATAGFSGDASGKPWQRAIKVASGIRFKEIWVDYRDDGIKKGQVAIYFFPSGAATKAVIELTDGTDPYTILVHGLTGRVEVRDGALDDIDEHMLRNAMGDKNEKRETEQ